MKTLYDSSKYANDLVNCGLTCIRVLTDEDESKTIQKNMVIFPWNRQNIWSVLLRCGTKIIGASRTPPEKLKFRLD